MKFSNPILARIEAEFPAFARDLKKLQAEEHERAGAFGFSQPLRRCGHPGGQDDHRDRLTSPAGRVHDPARYFLSMET